MRALACLALLCAIASARPCAAEDRTERIAGSKGWKELDYRGDKLAEERSFDTSGALLEERSFNAASLPVVTKRYIRSGGLLLRVEASDAAGSPIGSMSYHYDRDGRLLIARAAGVFGDEAAGIVASEGSPQGSFVESSSAATVLAYDGQGRATLLQDMKEGKVSRIERRTYGEKGAIASIAVEDKSSGSTTTISYDEAGRESGRRAVGPKGEETVTSYGYDDSGRLLEERTAVGDHELSVKRIYAEGGALARAETRRDGALVLAVDYAGDGKTEELYEDGRVFVKASYKGGRKVKDEFYADGKLERTREYQ
jgi:antitoxin component YwqK of YwqJK toxin-antitoxin module